MSYEATKRVYLEDGGGLNILKKRSWADVYLELRHGTQRAVQALVRPMTKGQDGGAPPKIVVDAGGEMKVNGGTTIEIPLDKMDFTAINDVIILGQVKEWSLGPVDQATLDGLPENIYQRLVTEIDAMYGGQFPLAKGGGGN